MTAARESAADACADARIIRALLHADRKKLPAEAWRALSLSNEIFEGAGCRAIGAALNAAMRNGKSIRQHLEADYLLELEIYETSQEVEPIESVLGDLRKKLNSFALRSLQRAANEAEQVPYRAAQIARDFASSTLVNLEDPNEQQSLPEILDVADFTAKQLPQPAELIAGVLHRGSKLVLGGGSKSFKTWTLLDLALSVAHGLPWLNFDTTQGRVLFLNFEIQPWSWQRRIEAVAKAKGIELEPGKFSVSNLRGRAANFAFLLPQIRAAAKQEFALIVLDPIYKLYGATDENKAGDVAALLNGIEDLAVTTGAGVAFGAHFSKGNQAAKESIDRISGSGVFARDPDSLLVFTKHEEQDAFTVEPTLRNFAPVEPFAVRWQYPLMLPDAQLDPSKLKQAGGRKPTHSPGDLLRVLNPGGMDDKSWKSAAESIGIAKTSYYRLKKDLEQKDRVILDPVRLLWKPVKSA